MRVHNPREIDIKQDSMADDSRGRGGGSSADIGRLTGTERRELTTALRFHQAHAKRTADDLPDSGFFGAFKQVSRFAEALLLDPHQQLIDELEQTDAPRFDPKTRLLILDTIDLYSGSGIPAASVRALREARSKLD